MQRFNKISCQFIIALYISLLSISVSAEDDAFIKLKLGYGISIEVPKHWGELGDATKMNLHATSQAALANSGIKLMPGQKITLLAMNATPDPAGAIIRVSVKMPPDFSQAELLAFTEADLAEIGGVFFNTMSGVMTSLDGKLIKMFAPRKEIINGHKALLLSYIRNSNFGPSNWQVDQYKIPTEDGRFIEFTLSRRLSDEIMWRTIQERVKRSIRF